MSQILKPKKGYKKVKWLLGKDIFIPEEWNIETLGSTCDQIQDMDHKMPKKIKEGIPFLSISDIVNKSEIDFSNQKYISKEDYADFLKKLQPKKNDLLYSRVATIGESRIIREEKKFAFTYNVVLIKTGKKIVSLFLKYALDFPMIKNRVKSIAPQGAYPFLGLGDIEKIPIIVPPLSEQQKIATILFNIDKLITSTQKIIEDVTTLKQGLTQKLFTKGIDHKKFKKVNFHFGKIIKIPEEWEVKQLKEYVSKIGSGVTPKGGSSVYLKKGIPLIRSQNVHFEGLSLENVAFISEEIHNDMKNTQLMEYDVLLNITGASIGRCTYIPTNFGEGNVNQHVCIIRPKAKLFYSFLAYVLSSNLLQNIIQSSQVGLSREGLNFKEMGDFVFPLPSLPEQQQIATILSNVDSQIQSQTQYKEKLERLKKSLMQKLLTGEVRVSI